jgi:hypothetical protein
MNNKRKKISMGFKKKKRKLLWEWKINQIKKVFALAGERP